MAPSVITETHRTPSTDVWSSSPALPNRGATGVRSAAQAGYHELRDGSPEEAVNPDDPKLAQMEAAYPGQGVARSRTMSGRSTSFS